MKNLLASAILVLSATTHIHAADAGASFPIKHVTLEEALASEYVDMTHYVSKDWHPSLPYAVITVPKADGTVVKVEVDFEKSFAICDIVGISQYSSGGSADVFVSFEDQGEDGLNACSIRLFGSALPVEKTVVLGYDINN